MANQIIFALPRVTDDNGDVVSGAKAYFYQTGTTSPVTVYSDIALTVAHASPVVADSTGLFAQVFYGGATNVKVVVKTSADVDIYTLDPVPMVFGSQSGADTVSFAPISGNAATNVQAAIAVNTALATSKVSPTVTVTGGGIATGGGDLSANRVVTVTVASQAEAEAGVLNTVAITPLSAKYADINAINTLTFGTAHTWVDYSGTRSTNNVAYQNTKAYPIEVSMHLVNGGGTTIRRSPDNITFHTVAYVDGGGMTTNFIVPPGWYYKVSATSTVTFWGQLE